MDATAPDTTAPGTTAPGTTAPGTTAAPSTTTARSTARTSAEPATAHRTTTAPARRGAGTGPTGSRRSAPAAPEQQRHLHLVGAAGAGDAGMATAEYAIATLAACGFAALLVAILGGGEVRGMLLALVERALSVV